MKQNYNQWQTAIRETRRRRLKQLIDEYFEGSLVEAERRGIGRKATQIGSAIAGRRGIGEEMARSIECAVGLPLGWMDSDLRVGATLVPPGVSERIEQLYLAAAEGRIGWDVLTAALEGAVAVADALPAPERKRLT